MDEEQRFRRALKNPFVMIGLCVTAGMVVYVNVIEPTMQTSGISAIAQSPPSRKNLRTETPARQAHDEEAIRWIDKPSRDPFAPAVFEQLIVKNSKPSLRRSRQSQAATHVRHKSEKATLTLKAVAIEAKNRSAVINRQVVYEGEMVEGYQVVSIQLKGVLLTRHGKKRFLTFTTNPTS